MDILFVIREFLHERLDVAPEKIQPETTLEELQVDSLMIVELLFECEEKFGVTFERDTATPKTIADMVAIVEGVVAAARAKEAAPVAAE